MILRSVAITGIMGKRATNVQQISGRKAKGTEKTQFGKRRPREL
jgi:hypothetical protein